MSALKRTNIYLTEAQRRAFTTLARDDGLSVSEHMRRALDAYLADLAHIRQPRWRPNPPLTDAEGYVHATLSSIMAEETIFDAYDVLRFRWTFTAPGERRPLTHDFWTGRTFEYHPCPGIQYVGHEPRPNYLARLLLALQVVTAEGFQTQRADTLLADRDIESLIGTLVKYRLGTVHDPFAAPPDDYDPAGDTSDPPWYQLSAGPDLETLTLDQSAPPTQQEPSL